MYKYIAIKRYCKWSSSIYGFCFDVCVNRGIADLRARLLVCVCVCARLLGSARLLLFFVYCCFFFLISLYTRIFLFMQLMSAYDTAALVPAAVYIVLLLIFFYVYQNHLAGDLNTIFRLDLILFLFLLVHFFIRMSVLKRLPSYIIYKLYFHFFFSFRLFKKILCSHSLTHTNGTSAPMYSHTIYRIILELIYLKITLTIQTCTRTYMFIS